MKYHEIMWAEMKPDVYAGESCDQVAPRWQVHSEGDMDSGYIDVVELGAKHFQPGTKIKILEPCCEKCGQIQELCRSDDDCDFDWDAWVLEQYS